MVSLLRRACAWAALVTFSAVFGLGAITAGHLGPEDDAACVQRETTTGHPRVQFETASHSSSPAHCPFCHWQRVVGGTDFAAAHAGGAPLEPLDRVPPPGEHALRSAALDEHLSRGPPRR